MTSGKAFGRTQALAGVAFSLRSGEIHALVGANGAGKSTFARIVSGRLSADRGEIRLFGAPARFASAYEAVIPEGRYVVPFYDTG